ncbi:sugar phosphate isomerase/epimerase family protein [Arthrobacter sp. NPDC058097]|uniref:sugar phosphate isomerase/epimerase family protein n=1 Tax=Arthrobacter sp. NPDC058097 TaxID=3346340 RepID=UPI0036DC587B
MSDAMTPGTPVQGVTLYSFTRLFHSRQVSFEDLVRNVAKRGLGPGLEIVGFQSIREFPNVGDDFIRRFRSIIDETGLVPSAFGANADANLRRDRPLTNDELVEYMTKQIVVAKKLGFPVVRLQYALSPDDMERLLPIAEREGVRLGIEIHAHHSVKHPIFQAHLERFEKLGSPYLGFIPDWGVSMYQFPRTLLESYRRKGIPEEVIAMAESHWNEAHKRGQLIDDHAIHEEMVQFTDKAAPLCGHETAFSIAIQAVGMFGHQSPQAWAEILPWAVHTHGKFYEIDSTGTETSVPLPEIIKEYVDAGYSNVISSEYEGFHWNTWDDPFDQIAGQQAALRKAAEAAGSRLITDTEEARKLSGVSV